MREADESRSSVARRSTVAVCVSLSLCSSAALYGQVAQSAAERQVTTSAPGPQRLPVDVTLLAAGQPFRVTQRGDVAIAEGGLADLRFFDAQGQPVPHLLVDAARGEPAWEGATVLPVATTKRTSGFEADLGAARNVDVLRVEGIPAPFLKRLVLEGSGDRQRWTVLVGEGTLFDLPEERLRQTALAFPSGPYRFLRVTWDDANSGRVPLPRAVAARLASSVPAPPVTFIDLAVDRRPSEPGRSRYRIRLPGAKLPIVAFQMDAGGGHVYRRATVSESRFSGTEATPARLGDAMLVRVMREAVSAAALQVPVSQPSEPEVDLVIEDGSNPPLEIRKVSAVLAQLPWIYVEAPAGAIVARYGHPTLQRPTYDLEALRETVDLSAVPVATWGEARSLVESGAAPSGVPMPEAGADMDPGSFRFARQIPGSRSGLVALTIDPATLAHSRGPSARFADLRVLDGRNRQIPYLLERRDEPLAIDLAVSPAARLQAAELTREDGGRRSAYALAIPYAHLPAGTLVVETSARVFRRNVRVGVERPADRHHRTAWFDVAASADWQHVDQQTTARPLSLNLGGLDRTDVILVVDEGDNAPLPIAGVRLLLPQYRLRFFQPEGAELRLVYGRADLELPRYDLALLAPQVMGATAREAAASREEGGTNQLSQPPLLSPLMFWILLGVSVLVLVGLIVRLVRTG